MMNITHFYHILKENISTINSHYVTNNYYVGALLSNTRSFWKIKVSLELFLATYWVGLMVRQVSRFKVFYVCHVEIIYI